MTLTSDVNRFSPNVIGGRLLVTTTSEISGNPKGGEYNDEFPHVADVPSYDDGCHVYVVRKASSDGSRHDGREMEGHVLEVMNSGRWIRQGAVMRSALTIPAFAQVFVRVDLILALKQG